MSNIVPASEKLRQSTSGRHPLKSDYKWREIEIGQAFVIDIQKLKRASLVAMAHKMGKKLGCKFKIAEHEGPININGVNYPNGVYEIGKFGR